MHRWNGRFFARFEVPSDAADDRVFWDVTMCQEDRSYWLNMLEEMGIGKKNVHKRMTGEGLDRYATYWRSGDGQVGGDKCLFISADKLWDCIVSTGVQNGAR
jgi:hypothetical protein